MQLGDERHPVGNFNQSENMMSKLLSRFRRDESGATAIEYGLIAALISVAIIAGASTLGNNLSDTFNNISDKVKNPNGTPSTNG